MAIQIQFSGISDVNRKGFQQPEQQKWLLRFQNVQLNLNKVDLIFVSVLQRARFSTRTQKENMKTLVFSLFQNPHMKSMLAFIPFSL